MGIRPRPAAVLAASVGLAAAVVAAATGCRTRQQQPAPAPSDTGAPLLGPDTRPLAVGELGHAHDYRMSIDAPKDCPMSAPFEAKRGFVKVGIEMDIEGTSALEVPVNPFYATLTDATDTYASTLAGCEPSLPSIRLTTGKKAHGFVTFEIPKTSRKLELRYAPVVIGNGAEELKFRLTR